MLVCVKFEANTKIQFDIKKFNITLMAIIVTHIISMKLVGVWCVLYQWFINACIDKKKKTYRKGMKNSILNFGENHKQ